MATLIVLCFSLQGACGGDGCGAGAFLTPCLLSHQALRPYSHVKQGNNACQCLVYRFAPWFVWMRAAHMVRGFDMSVALLAGRLQRRHGCLGHPKCGGHSGEHVLCSS